MTIDWGSVPANSVLPFIFTSHDAITGANETMSGLALADIVIYKGVSLTQRSSTAGFAFFGGDADGLDLDTFTGVNGVSIDTSDNTDAGFYAVGSFYTVVLGPVTIDAQTVYTVLGTFRLMAAEAIAGKPKADVDAWNGTAVSAPATAGIPEVNLKNIVNVAVSTSTAQLGVNAVQAGATAWNSGAIKTTSFTAGAIDAAALAADASTEINAAVLAVLGALADAASDGEVTSTDTVMAYIKQLINVLIGAAGIVAFPASAVPGNAVSLAEVIRQIYDEVAGVNGITPAAVADVPTAAVNAAAVWDLDATAHQTGGTFGQAIGDPGADTNTIFKAVVTDADGATVGVDVTNLPTNAELATSQGTADDATLAAIAALNNLSAAQVNAEVVDALNVDTYAEPGQATPGATATLAAKINYLYKLFRNRKTTTSSQFSLYNDDAATVDQKATLSDDGVTYTQGEIATGP